MKLRMFFFLIVVLSFSCSERKNISRFNQNFINKLGFEEMMITLPEVWTIEREQVITQGTWIVSKTLGSVKVFVDQEPGIEMEDFAKKIAVYAIENGYTKNFEEWAKYSKEFQIERSIIISLIQQKGKGFMTENNGYHFIFEIDDLIGNGSFEKREPLPISFNHSAIEKIEATLNTSFKNKDLDILRTLYSQNAIDDFSMEETGKIFQKVFKKKDKIEYIKYVFYTYLGKRDGVRGYYTYFKIRYFDSRKNEYKEDYIRLLIVDEKPEFGIFGINYNYSM